MRRLRTAATLVGALVAILAVWTPAAGAVGGPVVLGGDDLTVSAVAQGRDAAESIHRALTSNGRA